MVTDVGGIDDASFNATSWRGVEMAIEELGVEGQYLESQQQTDYARNITEFLQQDYALIIPSVSFWARIPPPLPSRIRTRPCHR